MGDVELSDAEREVVDAVGRLIEFWGFKRHMGRMWALLYLRPEPLGAKEIREALDLSAGTVSMTLNELQRWGVVRLVMRDGIRSELFEAEESLWGMISRVFRERELVEIDGAVASFERAMAVLGQREGSLARRQLARVGQLLEVAKLGQSLLRALVSTGRVDATSLASVLLGRVDR